MRRGMVAVAMMAARPSAVIGSACQRPRPAPWRATPRSTRRTPSWSAGSAAPWSTWAARIVPTVAVAAPGLVRAAEYAAAPPARTRTVETTTRPPMTTARTLTRCCRWAKCRASLASLHVSRPYPRAPLGDRLPVVLIVAGTVPPLVLGRTPAALLSGGQRSRARKTYRSSRYSASSTTPWSLHRFGTSLARPHHV